jgi:prepilin-type N-terminal cleavage/methylation domain-containing protein
MTFRLKRGSAKAFTLIELMLAMGIFAGIMAGIYASWYTIIRGSKSGLEAAANVQRARIAIQCVEDALLTVQVFNQNITHYSFEADSTEEFAQLSLVSKLPKSFPRSGKFGDLDVRRVTFTVEPGPDRLNQLVMRQQPYLCETNQDEELFPIVLAKDIRMFTLEFWDASKGDWVTGAAYTNQLPQMVRVSMAFGNGKSAKVAIADVVSRTVGMAAVVVPQQYQVPQLPAAQAVGGGAGGGRGQNQNPNGQPRNNPNDPNNGQPRNNPNNPPNGNPNRPNNRPTFGPGR